MARPGPVHPDRHPLHGERMRVKLFAEIPAGGIQTQDTVTVVDWHDRVTGNRVRDVFGDYRQSPASRYMTRVRRNPPAFPRDEEIVIVQHPKTGMHAVHQKELYHVAETTTEETREEG